MLNRKLMESEIRKSGLKKGYIASSLGLSAQGFYKKLKTGKFTTDEANEFCKTLGISSIRIKCNIFFAENVDENGNINGGDNNENRKMEQS